MSGWEPAWPQDTSGQGAEGSCGSHSYKRQLGDMVRNMGGDRSRVQMSSGDQGPNRSEIVQRGKEKQKVLWGTRKV